jgi:hypothetical protein
VPKVGSSAGQLGCSHGRTGPRSKSSADGEVELDAEKSPEEVAAEQDGVPEGKAETMTEVGPTHDNRQTGQSGFLNWTIWFH